MCVLGRALNGSTKKLQPGGAPRRRKQQYIKELWAQPQLRYQAIRTAACRQEATPRAAYAEYDSNYVYDYQ